MAYRRKRQAFRRKRKVFRRKKRVVRRRTTRRRGNKVYAKFCLEGSTTVTGGTPVITSNAISVNDMATPSGGTTTITAYCNLYQEYRIRKLKWKFFPRGVANNFTWADDAPHGGTCCTAIDYNDIIPATNFQQLARSANARIHSLNAPFGRYFTPCVLGVVQTSTGTTVSGNSPRFSPWLKTNAIMVEHYGLKTFFRAPGATTAKYHVDYVVTAYLQFRGAQ